MDAIREYLLTVALAAIICAVIKRLLDRKGIPAAIARLLTGIFMTVTVLSPLTGISLGGLSDMTGDFRIRAEQAVQSGKKLTADSMRKDIMEQTRAYILDKAEDMGAQIDVQVTLSDDYYPVPKQVTISGSIGPYAKKRLQSILREDLGVPEEYQIWT